MPLTALGCRRGDGAFYNHGAGQPAMTTAGPLGYTAHIVVTQLHARGPW